VANAAILLKLAIENDEDFAQTDCTDALGTNATCAPWRLHRLWGEDVARDNLANSSISKVSSQPYTCSHHQARYQSSNFAHRSSKCLDQLIPTPPKPPFSASLSFPFVSCCRLRLRRPIDRLLLHAAATRNCPRRQPAHLRSLHPALRPHLIILAIRVVIAKLRPPDFVSHHQHRSADREQIERQGVAYLACT
jgi:hypothetical protein